MKKHFLESHSHKTTDVETGEVVEIESHKIVKVNMGRQEEFFMTFCNELGSFYGLKYADDMKLIIKFNEWAVFDTGVVDLTPKKRGEIFTELGIRSDAISKSLKRLREKGLISGDKGEFIINPVIFWKGDKAKRKELLKSVGLKFQINFKMDK